MTTTASNVTAGQTITHNGETHRVLAAREANMTDRDGKPCIYLVVDDTDNGWGWMLSNSQTVTVAA